MEHQELSEHGQINDLHISNTHIKQYSSPTPKRHTTIKYKIKQFFSFRPRIYNVEEKYHARNILMQGTYHFLLSLPHWHRDHIRLQIRKSLLSLQRDPYQVPEKPKSPIGAEAMSFKRRAAYMDPILLVHTYYKEAKRLQDIYLYTYLLDHLNDLDSAPLSSSSPHPQNPQPLNDPLFHYMDRQQYGVQVWEHSDLQTPLSLICEEKLNAIRDGSPRTSIGRNDRKSTSSSESERRRLNLTRAAKSEKSN